MANSEPGDALTARVDVWQAELDLEASEVAALARLLSAEETARAARFHFARDRQRYIVARATLRLRLSHALGCDPASLTFQYGKYGKPYLLPEHGAIHFNVSHTDGLALIAVTRVGEVGIDVERMRDDFAVDSVAAQVFTPEEQQTLAALSESAHQERFYRYWTRKEAYMKAKGDGLSLEPKRIDVSRALEPSGDFFRIRQDGHMVSDVLVRDLPLEAENAARSCVASLAIAGYPVEVIMHL